MRHRSGSTRGRVMLGVAAAVVLVVVGCLVVLMSGPSEAEPASAPPPAVLEIEEDGLRFVYHLPTGQGSLFDLESDPRALRNLADDRPDDVERLRARLAAQQGVDDLESLREHFKESIEALRRLGYL